MVRCVGIGNDMDTTTNYHDRDIWRTSSLPCSGMQYGPCAGVVRLRSCWGNDGSSPWARECMVRYCASGSLLVILYGNAVVPD